MKIVHLIIPAFILMFPIHVNAQTATTGSQLTSPLPASSSALDQLPNIATPSSNLLDSTPSQSLMPTSSPGSSLPTTTDTMRNIIAFGSIALLIIIAFSAGKLSAKQDNRE